MTAASLPCQIASLTKQLAHCKSELQQHSALVKTVQKELEAARDEVSVQCAAGERLTGEVEAYKEILKGRDAERTQLKADILTLETKLKASQEEQARKEKEIQRQMRGMENKYGEQLRGLNQTQEKCKELERSCSQLEVVRGTLERRVTALGVENEELRVRLDAAERKERELVGQRNEAEGRVKEGEAELKSTVAQLQQEVAHRAQQVSWPCLCVCRRMWWCYCKDTEHASCVLAPLHVHLGLQETAAAHAEGHNPRVLFYGMCFHSCTYTYAYFT